MRTVSQSQIATILEYLDAASVALPPSPVPGIESTAAWNIRMARRWLYRAALGEIAIEPIAANDEATLREAA
jgi:hypothetical protein